MRPIEKAPEENLSWAWIAKDNGVGYFWHTSCILYRISCFEDSKAVHVLLETTVPESAAKTDEGAVRFWNQIAFQRLGVGPPVTTAGKRGVSMEIKIFDMLADSFGPVIAIFAVFVFSIIAAIRFAFRFDLNSYLDSRKKRHLGIARLECPHMTLCKTENGIAVQSLFVSPPGALSYQCRQCGLITNRPPSNGELMQMAESLANDFDTYKKRMHRFDKHMKKSL